ncbi:hypothetical protein AB205_0110060 [Aquarana catesbeiana]|uniref:SRCR domain-containing protein n=1 Tax=Aquarana catesbeiana TaxID=8400 RepID=A0A2G9SDN8_AQUCT|nr:hypothetical protein AB205_0110060 [Aquarana catesbeiana]
MVHANDGTHRFFIAEQMGYVWVYLPNGSRVDKPFLNVSKAVLTSPWAGDERGFLGIAMHPDFRHNGKFYVYYSIYAKKAEKIRISEFHLSTDNMNMADHKSERIILEVTEPASNHNGGQILFGIDGYLYIFTGDGGRAGDPFGDFGNAQNKSSLLGKVLRINVTGNDKGPPYRIPPDNPFLREPTARPEVYAYGARNMWRCSVDRGDPVTGKGRGRIICGDVGQNKFEEVDLIQKGGNYGWRAKEGFSCYDKKLCNNASLNDILPIYAYPHSMGKSVTGGYIYRGCQMPNLMGRYIFGDFMSGRAAPGKCPLNARSVPIKGKLVDFYPRQKLILKTTTESPPTSPASRSLDPTKFSTTTQPHITVTPPTSSSYRKSSTPAYITAAPVPRLATPRKTVTPAPKAEKGATAAKKPVKVTVTSRPMTNRWIQTKGWQSELKDLFTARTRSQSVQIPILLTTGQPSQRRTQSGGKTEPKKSPGIKKTKTKVVKKQRVKVLKKIKHGTVRLVNEENLPDRGRVEIHINGEWGTVCNDRFDSKAALVVCRQLGYPYVLKVARRAEFGEGKGLRILLDEVKCQGRERTLLECQRSKLGEHDCAHDEDIGVVCGMQEKQEDEFKLT